MRERAPAHSRNTDPGMFVRAFNRMHDHDKMSLIAFVTVPWFVGLTNPARAVLAFGDARVRERVGFVPIHNNMTGASSPGAYRQALARMVLHGFKLPDLALTYASLIEWTETSQANTVGGRG